MTISTTLVWAILGLILALGEIFSGTFFLLFFGIAALLVALLKKISGLENLSIEIISFALLGIAQLFIFRKKILLSLQPTQNFSSLSEKKITLNASIAPRQSANISYQGSTWTAVNETDWEMKQGETVYIDRTEGIKLILKTL